MSETISPPLSGRKTQRRWSFSITASGQMPTDTPVRERATAPAAQRPMTATSPPRPSQVAQHVSHPVSQHMGHMIRRSC